MPDETDAKKILTASPLGELDETTRMPSYNVDEDYPAEPEIKTSFPTASDSISRTARNRDKNGMKMTGCPSRQPTN